MTRRRLALIAAFALLWSALIAMAQDHPRPDRVHTVAPRSAP